MQKYARLTGAPDEAEIFDGSKDVFTGEGDDTVHHPRNIVTLWSAAELAAIGLLPLDVAIIPPGHSVATRSYAEVAGRIVESAVTTPPPPPTPEQILRTRAGKLDMGRLTAALVRSGAIPKADVPADQLDALNALAAIDGKAPL